jgi:hypothetical protein
MADVTLTLDPKFERASSEDVLKMFDEEVERFSKFMEGLSTNMGGALIPQEKVLLKTYLVHKHRGRLNGQS